MRKALKKLQQGISLLEVMLSLSIIAVIIVMATRYYQTASENNNLNTVREQVGAVISAVLNYRNDNGHFDSLTMGKLINQDYLPRSGSVSGDGDTAQLFTPYGEMTLTPQTSGGSSHSNYVQIKISSVPEGHACYSLCKTFPNAKIGGTACDSSSLKVDTCNAGAFELNVPNAATNTPS